MPQARTPEQLQSYIDLVKERIESFELAMYLYRSFPPEKKPKTLVFDYLEKRVTELKRDFNELSKSLKKSRETLRMNPTIIQRMNSQEENFENFLNRIQPNNNLHNSDESTPTEVRSSFLRPRTQASASLQAILDTNNRCFSRIDHMKEKMLGDPNLLRIPLITLANNLLSALKSQYERTEHQHLFIGKLAEEFNLLSSGKNKKGVLLFNFDHFREAFDRTYDGKPLHAYDPQMISVINQWLKKQDPDYELPQQELKTLQANQPFKIDTEHNELFLDQNIQEQINAKKSQLVTDIINWMQHTKEYLFPSLDNLQREAEFFNRIINKEVSDLKQVARYKESIREILEENKKLQDEYGHLINQNPTPTFWQNALDALANLGLVLRYLAESDTPRISDTAKDFIKSAKTELKSAHKQVRSLAKPSLHPSDIKPTEHPHSHPLKFFDKAPKTEKPNLTTVESTQSNKRRKGL